MTRFVVPSVRRVGAGLAAWLVLASPVGLWAADAASAASAASAPAAAAPLLQIDGQAVSWPEIWFWLQFAAKHHKAALGLSQLNDWGPGPDGVLLKDRLLNTALSLARQERAIERQAAAHGLSLSDEDLRPMAEERQRQMKVYGSVEYRRIVTRMYGSEAVMDYLGRIDLLGQRLFEQLYGPRGERCSDEDVARYIAAAQLQHLQYVVVPLVNAQGKPLAAPERRRRQAQVQALHQRLRQAADPGAVMEQAIHTLGEDDAMLQEPAGRIVSAGRLPPEVDAAYQQLADGQLSGVLSTAKGLYVLRRLPLNGEVQQGATGRSLRYWAAYNHLYKRQVATWADALPVLETPAYRQLNVEKLVR